MNDPRHIQLLKQQFRHQPERLRVILAREGYTPDRPVRRIVRRNGHPLVRQEVHIHLQEHITEQRGGGSVIDVLMNVIRIGAAGIAVILAL